MKWIASKLTNLFQSKNPTEKSPMSELIPRNLPIPRPKAEGTIPTKRKEKFKKEKKYVSFDYYSSKSKERKPAGI